MNKTPFDPRKICTKCGSKVSHNIYIKLGPHPKPGKPLETCSIVQTHIHRICNCGYGWIENLPPKIRPLEDFLEDFNAFPSCPHCGSMAIGISIPEGNDNEDFHLFGAIYIPCTIFRRHIHKMCSHCYYDWAEAWPSQEWLDRDRRYQEGIGEAPESGI